MTQTVASLQATLSLDASRFTSGLRTAKAEAQGLGSTLGGGLNTGPAAAGLGRMTSALGGLGAVMGGLGLGVGAAQILRFGQATVMAASAAEESQNKMKVVFGSSSAAITSFAKNAARDLGMSKTQAIEAAGTFGNLFTSMGLGRPAAASMSQGIVQLAADLGSFNNIPIDVMLEKMRSGMVGEVEPLRAVGINLSAAAVTARALQMGLADANGAISQAAMLQARYAVMLDQSTNAQGDFAHTSDGLANSMKIADAEVDNLKEQLGLLTIKPYTAVVHVVASGLGNLNADLQALSSDNAVRLPALQQRLTEMQKAYAAALADGVDAQGPAMTQLAGSMEAISAELRNAKSNAEIAGDAGVSAAARTAAAMYAASAASIVWGDAGAGAGLRIAAAAEAAKQAIEQANAAARLMPQRTDFSQSSSAWAGGGSGNFYSAIFKNDRAQDNKEADEAARKRLDQIKLTQSVAGSAISAIQAKFNALAGTVTTALDDASKKAKGLFDFGGAGPGGGIVTEPGKNGPFEALYRITDVAATLAGRAPGADTAQWQSMYAGADFTGIAKNFQAGNLLAPGVFENIDWGLLGQQATQQQDASKISTYAGQAVAGLKAAGKEVTPENMKAMIDELAAKDRNSIVPSLDNINTSLGGLQDSQHTDFADTIAAVNGVTDAINNAKAPPTVTPPSPVTPPVGPPPQTIPIFAGGTSYAPGGLALVGELGPELVQMPAGARVYPRGQTPPRSAGNNQLDALAEAIQAKTADASAIVQALADQLVAGATGVVLRGLAQQFSRI